MVANCGLHSENHFNYDQNYPKRPNQSQEYVFFQFILEQIVIHLCNILPSLKVVEKKDAFWQNYNSAFCYLYSASHLTDLGLA